MSVTSRKLDLSNIVFPKTLIVTGQVVDISQMTEDQKQAYIELFREMTEIYERKQKTRMIIGIVGPTGAGKSVMVALFAEFAKQIPLSFRFETLGIDAFHHTNNFLLAHFSDRIPLKNVKGRFDTYDVKKLEQTLTNFSLGKMVSLPAYSRVTHDPVENVTDIKEEKVLLLVEGLWLLYDRGGWEKIARFLDFSLFIKADKEKVRMGVVARHTRGGRTAQESFEYYDTIDVRNFDLVMETRKRADRVIGIYHGSRV